MAIEILLDAHYLDISSQSFSVGILSNFGMPSFIKPMSQLACELT